MNTQRLLKYSGVLALLACQSFVQAQELRPLTAGQFAQPLPKAAVAPVSLANGTATLVASKHGFLLLDDKGEPLAQAMPAAELLDVRESINVTLDGFAKKITLAASIALPEQQPIIMAVDVAGHSIRELARLPVPDSKIANLCLSHDQANRVSVFILDERGNAQHWLILDSEGNTRIRHLRNLAVPPDAKACGVDDAQERLYIAEESVGVWSYDASIESDGSRHAVDMAAPFGKLLTGAKTVAAVPGLLFALVPDAKQLLVYNTDKDNTLLRSISLATLVKPDAVSAHWSKDKKVVELFVFDDKTSKVHQLEVPAPEIKAPVQTHKVVRVKPEVQTQVMARFGDAADDPAIWVNAQNPAASRVIGTNKQQGLFVYDLQGQELQHFDTGRLNNVDVRRQVVLGNEKIDLAIATNRDHDSLSVFTIDANGQLASAGEIATGLKDIYGICLYQSPAKSGKPSALYAFANGKSGAFEQIRIGGRKIAADQWQWQGEKVRAFAVGSQPEGCVADDARQQLFLGEEDVGIWTIGAEPSAGIQPKSIAKVGGNLVADVEGMGLYLGKKHNYLVVSSQGNNTYIVYDTTAPYKERGVIQVELDADKNIDGSSETDGLEVTSINLGGAFGEGMLVVQDGHKVMPAAPQNFKYISWEKIRRALGLPL